MPTSHSKQLDWPVVSWYLPVAQSSHDVESVNGCAEPPAHSMQLLWPFLSLYLPTSHGMHVEMLGAAIVGVYVPDGHLVKAMGVAVVALGSTGGSSQ